MIRRLLWPLEMPYRGDQHGWLVRNIIKWFPRRRDWIVASLIREEFFHLHCLRCLA